MEMNSKQKEFGVGVTKELNLRVSVAALVRVLIHTSGGEKTMLALERAATLRKVNGRSEVQVRAKPFGGGVRITNPRALKELIGNFNYDSEQSRRESDFRIQVSQSSWNKVKEICRNNFMETDEGILDPSPGRELREEFEDTLHVRITPDQYRLEQIRMVVEDLPVKTDNVRAAGLSTVRIYYVFEARIVAHDLIARMLVNNRRYSDEELQKLALKNFRQGGKGKANTILLLGLDRLKKVYGSIPADRRAHPMFVDGHQLEGNVRAILM